MQYLSGRNTAMKTFWVETFSDTFVQSQTLNVIGPTETEYGNITSNSITTCFKYN